MPRILTFACNALRSWRTAASNGRLGKISNATAAPRQPAARRWRRTFPPAVAPVLPGIEARFRALVQSIKTNANYNESIGQALEIEGPDQTGPNLTAIQPAISAIISGNHVLIKWGWGGHSTYLDMCELQVDRGDGNGFVLLAYDTTPNYTDTQPFPAAPIKWTYRAIYRVADSRVGQWSLPVSVTVSA